MFSFLKKKSFLDQCLHFIFCMYFLLRLYIWEKLKWKNKTSRIINLLLFLTINGTVQWSNVQGKESYIKISRNKRLDMEFQSVHVHLFLDVNLTSFFASITWKTLKTFRDIKLNFLHLIPKHLKCFPLLFYHKIGILDARLEE